MKRILLAAAIAAATILPAIADTASNGKATDPGAEQATSTQPTTGTCRGMLMKLDSGEVVIGEPPDEDICTFGDADDAKKIMATCRIGQHCEVTGLVEICKDAGECTAISHVTAVTTAARPADYTYLCRVRRDRKSYPVVVNLDEGTMTWRGTTFRNLRNGDGCRVNFLATSDSGVTAELCTATKGVADLKIGNARFDCQLAP